jgi:D-arabinose 1-dehydrogenase-like Zn-dependent alcohol dehydrogenase
MWSLLDLAMPFGGVGQSGYGRENGPEGLDTTAHQIRRPQTSPDVILDPALKRRRFPSAAPTVSSTRRTLMFTTRAAVVEAPGAPFTVHEVTLADLRPDEILVRMVAAGLCHTDLGVQAGGIPFPLPGVLGHEGAGVVVETGPAVTRVKPGDKVLLSFTSCGACAACRGGHPAYCDTWVPRNLIFGARDDGSPTLERDGKQIGGRFFGQSSFAAHAVADQRSVVKVDDDAPLDLLAPLGCGVQTGFGTVWNILAPGLAPRWPCSGGSRASAVMAAAMLLQAVIAVDLVDARLDLAREPAHDTINPSQTSRQPGGHRRRPYWQRDRRPSCGRADRSGRPGSRHLRDRRRPPWHRGLVRGAEPAARQAARRRHPRRR